MGKPTGFLEADRETAKKRPVEERIQDWKEIYKPVAEDTLRKQAARCMDCGVPFCNQGCPLGNLIPDWNDLVYRGRWREAIEQLHKTNNFPEFTGRVCPAPCEASCVLAINSSAVSIKLVENEIIERAFKEGWIKPEPPSKRTGKRVAVVGSGPAGLAAAAQLNKAGHSVTIFERDNRIGGLLTYGIPDFKLEKDVVDRRVNIMIAEGIEFRTGVNIGKDISTTDLVRDYDAVVLCNGSTAPRAVAVPGSKLKGIHYAMDYLTRQNEVVHGDLGPGRPVIDAKGKDVVILGGGDTGADCFGTALRQGAKSVRQLEYNKRPPTERPDYNPWPHYPVTFYTLPAHEEGGERHWEVLTKEFMGDANGNVRALKLGKLQWGDGPKGKRTMEEVPGGEFELETNMVLIAIGYSGPERYGPIDELGLRLDSRGNVLADRHFMSSVPGVFVAGDMHRGQSLVVWAIAEGRKAARGVDTYLMGSSLLPG